VKLLSAIWFTQGLMIPHSGIDDNNKKDRTKAIAAAIPIAGIIVAAALLSGLSLVNSYQPAIAQQNMTAGGNATTTSPTTGGGGNATGSACAPTQTAGGAGGQNATTTVTNATTTGGGTNATTTAGGGNQTTTASPVQLIEQACIAAQNNDTQGVLMNLNLALNALGAGGNMTTAADGEDDDEEGEGGEEEEGEGGEEEEGEGGGAAG
jgi:hypothetical protein